MIFIVCIPHPSQAILKLSRSARGHTVMNFMEIVGHWIKFLLFFSFRNIKGFMVQTGDPTGQLWQCIKIICKIQLVDYYQCCIVIGWTTTRLYVIASFENQNNGGWIAFCLALTRKRCFVTIFFWPTSWILLKQLFHSPLWPLSQ